VGGFFFFPAWIALPDFHILDFGCLQRARHRVYLEKVNEITAPRCLAAGCLKKPF